MITPLEKALVWAQTSSSNVWHDYFYLRGVRAENRGLKQQIERMSLERVRISQDADQARRLQALLAFKEQFISATMAAQVIGGSGSELSRVVFIDKGYNDGIRPDMAVITADGVVGKVLEVYRVPSTSKVLLINDQSSGVGAILDKTRTQGILRGTASGEVVLEKVMSDETVPAGEMVLTSGGDGVFPKGLLVGRVTKVAPGSELFLNIHVRPAADLSRLEEVLVVTKIDERQAEPDQTGAVRAVDILAERLPAVPSKPEDAVKSSVPGTVAPGTIAPPSPGSDAKPKAASPEASTASGSPAARKPANSASSAGTGSGTSSGTSPVTRTANGAAKIPPKPVKTATEPKPQPAVEDSPH
jgi:rod shape-determining protein MreC